MLSVKLREGVRALIRGVGFHVLTVSIILRSPTTGFKQEFQWQYFLTDPPKTPNVSQHHAIGGSNPGEMHAGKRRTSQWLTCRLTPLFMKSVHSSLRSNTVERHAMRVGTIMSLKTVAASL